MKKKIMMKGILKRMGKAFFAILGILSALFYYLLNLVCGKYIYEQSLTNQYLPVLFRYTALMVIFQAGVGITWPFLYRHFAGMPGGETEAGKKRKLSLPFPAWWMLCLFWLPFLMLFTKLLFTCTDLNAAYKYLLCLLSALLVSSLLCLFLFYFLYKRLALMMEKRRGWALAIRSGLMAAGVLGIIPITMFTDSIFPYLPPKQDGEGVYLLSTKEDFEWFLEESGSGEYTADRILRVRLTRDIVLNDTEDWENWGESPPDHQYKTILYFHGELDGGGYALEGYCPQQEYPMIIIVEENSSVKNLTLEKSYFYTTFEKGSYDDDAGRKNIIPAAALCINNKGEIDNCSVEAIVRGSGEAAGIVNSNNGTIRDCIFMGTVEGGLYWQQDPQEHDWSGGVWRTGGICKSNKGEIIRCTNEGQVTAYAPVDCWYNGVCAGGIAGQNNSEGSVTECMNLGAIQSTELAGGISGSNFGGLYFCGNEGDVRVWPKKSGNVQYLASSGVSGVSEGAVDSCYSKGRVELVPDVPSYNTSIYGICLNQNKEGGNITNCYYLSGSAEQEYRQSGVFRLPAKEMEQVEEYLTGRKRVLTTDSMELLTADPAAIGTEEIETIHLRMGPEDTFLYEVKAGDTLWALAEEYYGDGMDIDILLEENKEAATGRLFIGQRLRIPSLDYYITHIRDEEGCSSYHTGFSPEERFPTRFLDVKPVYWYWGSTEADAGLSAIWNKYGTEKTRVLCYLDGNPEGDFFAADWSGARKSLRMSAEKWGGGAVTGLRFYRYAMDDGEWLYGYEFQTERVEGTLKCVVFYRMKENLLAEYIGFAPKEEAGGLLDRVRYQAARIESDLPLMEQEYTGKEFTGRENWEFQRLHNPFAISMIYSLKEENSPYVLWTGTQ